jgi:multicomponent Na+:H+ antiporter subunit F
MAEFLVGSAVIILAINAFSLFRVLRAQARVERMMAVQLLGSGGAAMALLLGTASQSQPMADVALLLVLLAAFSGSAFALGLPPAGARAQEKAERT